MSDATGTKGRLELRRTYPHPPEAVFDAWTDAEGMRSWMRPGPTRDVKADLDVREGGAYTISMIFEEGAIDHTGVYREVDRPRRLVFTWNAAHLPDETTVSLDFRPVDGGTELVLVHEGLPDEESTRNHTEGWGRILDLLGESLG